MLKSAFELLPPLVFIALLASCYGTAGPGGVQPYGTTGTGAIVPAPGQEIVHDYGRTCYIQCGGKDYVANCPAESKASCQCNQQPYAVCQ
ncbi:MAG: hypothetical protein V4650_15415 [Pseudomonadota bacterium]